MQGQGPSSRARARPARPLARSLARLGRAAAVLAATACAVTGCSSAPSPAGTAAAGSPAVAAPAPPPDWSRAVAVRLPAGGAPAGGLLQAVGCSPRGFCVAGGGYHSRSGFLPMTVTWSRGRWSRARALDLPASLLRGGAGGGITSVSCVSGTSCAAVGTYSVGGRTNGLLASMTADGWGAAQPLAPPAGLPGPLSIGLNSVACAGPGACVAVGADQAGSADQAGVGDEHGLVVAETGGRWGRPALLRAPADAKGGWFDPLSVACPAAGRCVAVGSYLDRVGAVLPAEASESNGAWGQARELRPPAGNPVNPFTSAVSVSCAAPGDCLAVGHYGFHDTGFAAAEVNGAWRPGRRILLSPAMTPLHSAVHGLACPAAGTCVAAGLSPAGAHPASGAMALAWSAGRWRSAVVRSPVGADRADGAGFTAVSCWSARDCVAVGLYFRSQWTELAMAAVSR